jgi:hypothetical protein
MHILALKVASHYDVKACVSTVDRNVNEVVLVEHYEENLEMNLHSIHEIWRQGGDGGKR